MGDERGASGLMEDLPNVDRAWRKTVGEQEAGDAYLTAYGRNLYAIAQLAAYRLGTRRALISVIGSEQTYVLEATKTLSPRCDKASAEAQLLLGQRSVPRGYEAGLCEFSAGDDAKKTAEIVPDCRQDGRFKDSKLVNREAGIRFYIAVPMLSNAGAQTGSLVVWDDVARHDIGDAEMRDLREYAQCAWRYLDMVRTSTNQPGASSSQGEQPPEALTLEMDQAQSAGLGHQPYEMTNVPDRTKSRPSSDRLERNQFLSKFSHELRSPIHGILGSVQFLQDTVSMDYQSSLLESIVISSNLLLDTINLVLEHNQLHVKQTPADETGSLDETPSAMFEPDQPLSGTADADISLLIENAVDTMVAGHFFDSLPDIADAGETELRRSNSPGKRGGIDRGSTKDVKVVLQLAARPGWSVKMQPGAITRIIMNLVGNSLKFTRTGVIEIALEPRSQSVDSAIHVRLRVEDTGIGMSEAFRRDRLFTPFEQENHFAPGVGLGMSVLRALVRSLGGTLAIASRPDAGTQVAIDFTFAASATQDEGLPQDLREIVRTLRGKHLVLLDVGRMHGGSEQSASLSKQEESIHSIARDWLGLRISHATHLNCPDADFFLYSEPPPADDLLENHRRTSSERPSNLEKPLIIVTTHSREAHMINTRHVRTLEGAGRIVQVLTQPCGPRKLAKVLSVAHHRAEQSQADRADLASRGQAKEHQNSVRGGGGGGVDRDQHGQAEDGEDLTSPNGPPSAMGEASAPDAAAAAARARPDYARQAGDEDAAEDAGERGEQDESTASTRSAQETESPFRKPLPLLSQSTDMATVEGAAEKEENSRVLHGLLVDDNKINLRLLVNFVRKSKHTYEQAETGEEAVAAVRNLMREAKTTSPDTSATASQTQTQTQTQDQDKTQKKEDHPSPRARPFDFILMDIGMPLLNGIDATRVIRALETERSCPRMLIVALTAWDDAATRAEAQAAGMDIFMPKPVKFADLKGLVDRLVEGKKGG
ncbi:hypothetical protein KC327_g17446 [Hortaea werneckii]|uniref:histidine kinase n=1 Tax=Hortaea werneckii EXF-2000 TaxID=1157616 RepID=A0A1Z5T1Y5_HORWE|nr:hypothetical protein KC358_g15172 [Hortaea werneckii]OTA29211.1 hypothetical protein BTJ68_13113 [Hortaea werneckii EXF-2000]KAI6804815.1 hypothetical protein KC350_g14866 [Hortaea werneckii]KAI6811675.1 hypothetical protein KC342_g17602 [Hortaea werneckii]KAI6904935.1 hypothetical protein KC348_g15137 [Hortaea werneckii]